jgi:cobalt transporter subunit CbtA
MAVFRAILFSAVTVGLIVGTLITVAQHFGTAPLILKAEIYEKAAHAGHDHSAGAHTQATAWEPANGFERSAYTLAANILTAVGFALLLTGAYAVRGHAVTWHDGLLWGLGGFATFMVAPSIGLPPEPPGIPAAALGVRQIWWIATVAATACGIGLIVFKKAAWAAIVAIILIAAPHLVGAPQPSETHSEVSPALARQFVIAATLTSFLLWVLLGTLTSIVYRYFSSTARRDETIQAS